MIVESIKTDRLLFEVISTDHLHELYDRMSEMNDFEYLPWKPHINMNDTNEFINEFQEKQSQSDMVGYIMRERQTSEIIGIGWINFEFETNSCSIGSVVFEEFRGQGFNQERAVAFFQLIFEFYDLETINIETAKENEDAVKSITKYVEKYFQSVNAFIEYNSAVINDEIVDNKVFQVQKSDYIKNEVDLDVEFMR